MTLEDLRGLPPPATGRLAYAIRFSCLPRPDRVARRPALHEKYRTASVGRATGDVFHPEPYLDSNEWAGDVVTVRGFICDVDTGKLEEADLSRSHGIDRLTVRTRVRRAANC
jgi:hypothetical protein